MDQQQAVSFLQDIIQIKSVNPPGNEKPVSEKIKATFEEHDIDCELVEYDENRSNLIAHLKAEKEGPVLGLTGHMDVVPPGENEWDHDPYGGEEENGKIYGRGASDMKSGLAACVLAMIALKEEGLPKKGEITLLATVGEEAGAVGAQQLTQKGYADSLDALIVAEPTDNKINNAHKGVLWPQLITYGRTAHGSMPEEGVNAVVGMNRIVQQLLSDDFKLDYEKDEELGEPSYSINVMQGGANTNTVPDQCRASIDIRTIPSMDHKQIIAQLSDVMESVKKTDPDLGSDIKILNDQIPMKTSKDDSFVQLVQDVVGATGGDTQLGGITGYTDSSQFIQSDKDFPVVVFGPGKTAVAHQPDEYVDVDKYMDSIQMFQEIAKKYLG